MVAEESDGSMQWFHFFDGIFLGQWYPEGFRAKSMVLKRFTPFHPLFFPSNSVKTTSFFVKSTSINSLVIWLYIPLQISTTGPSMVF